MEMFEQISPQLLQMEAITKQYPGILANDNIHFSLRASEVHSLLGENGAGKSTMMNILYGLTVPNSGKIFLNGKEIQINSPMDAISNGIGMVHQHFMLIDRLTVLENVIIGTKPVGYPLYIKEKAVENVQHLINTFGFGLNPSDIVADLSVGQQQRVEIIKTLYRGANIVILDEPTAVLTPLEVVDLFTLINKLKKAGNGIIFISHKLDEVLEISDRISILRQGKLVGTVAPRDVSKSDLANLMVGRPVVFEVPHPEFIGEKIPVLEIEQLIVQDNRKINKVDGINLKVHSGEILGIAGVAGNGQTELVEALTGLIPITGGNARVLGKNINGMTPKKIHDLGVAHIPEDRQRRGLVMDFRIDENLVLHDYKNSPFTKSGIMNYRKILRHGEDQSLAFDIRPPDPSLKAKQLSGGNQQKIILARELEKNPRLLIATQPTRGLDIGANEYVHNKIIEARQSGAAVLLVSTELDEVCSLSDRMIIIHKGKIIGELERGNFDLEIIGLMMGGVKVA